MLAFNDVVCVCMCVCVCAASVYGSREENNGDLVVHHGPTDRPTDRLTGYRTRGRNHHASRVNRQTGGTHTRTTDSTLC